MPRALKAFLARILFHLKTGNGGDFPRRVLVSFVKLMAYGDIGVGLSPPGVCSACCCSCSAAVRRSTLVVGRYCPDAGGDAPLKIGVTGIRQGPVHVRAVPRFCPLMKPFVPAVRQKVLARRKHSLQWTLALLTSCPLSAR